MTLNRLYNLASPQAFGLIGWWPVLASPNDQSAPVFDWSGRGNDAPASTRSTVFTPNAELGALRKAYNGTNYGYHVAPNAVEWNETDDLTVAVWAQFDALSDFDAVITRWNESVTRIWSVMISTSGIRFDTSSDGTFQAGNLASAASTLTTGANYHIACVHNSAAQTNKIYINGVLKGTTNSVQVGLFDGSLTVDIMHSPSWGGAERGLQGYFADARIYQVALSDDAIWQMFDPATRFDLYNAPESSWDHGVASGASLARSWGWVIG